MSIKKRPATTKRVTRSTFELAVVCAIVFFLLALIFGVRLFSKSTSDTTISDTLVEQIVSQEGKAREAAAMISRTGGSNTMQMLAITRQHLYALSQLNDLSKALLNTQVDQIPQRLIDAAIAQIESCDVLLQTGQFIDQPLSELWELLMQIAQAAANLTAVPDK